MVDLGKTLLRTIPQRACGHDGIGATQQVDGLGESLQRSGSDVGCLELLGEFHGPVQVGLGPQRVHRHHVSFDEAAACLPVLG